MCLNRGVSIEMSAGFTQGTHHIGKPVLSISHVVMKPRHHEPHLVSSQWLSPHPSPGYLPRPALEEHTLCTGLFHVCHTDMFSEGNCRREDACSWERQTCVLQKVDSGLLWSSLSQVKRWKVHYGNDNFPLDLASLYRPQKMWFWRNSLSIWGGG